MKRGGKRIYFFEAGLTNFESLLLILAALFFLITFFLAARSARDVANLTLSAFPVFFACRIATSSLLIIKVLTAAFLAEERKALFAVTVTGMRQV